MADEEVYPFYCGTQYADWLEENCLRCRKYNPDGPSHCEFDMALLTAALDDGSVSRRIADRMGFTAIEAADPPLLIWRCPEQQAGEPRGWLTVRESPAPGGPSTSYDEVGGP